MGDFSWGSPSARSHRGGLAGLNKLEILEMAGMGKQIQPVGERNIKFEYSSQDGAHTSLVMENESFHAMPARSLRTPLLHSYPAQLG